MSLQSRIETSITKAWQNQATWLYVLLPLSSLYGGISSIRRFLYKKGILSSYRADVPIMVIGNITVGGSGKTPLIISLVKQLQIQGIEVGVISRGYGGDTSQMPYIVSLDSTPDMVGDEPCLIVQSTIVDGSPVAMAVCPNRQQAIEILQTHNPDIQLIISDDGLQHYKLQRDIEWIVVDSHRGFGNEQLLPVGFLREPMCRIDGATVIYHQTNENMLPHAQFNLTMTLIADEFQSVQSILLTSIKNITKEISLKDITFPKQGDTVYAVSGIGYPKRFFDTLTNLGYHVIEHPYPDHYDFSLQDLLEITKNSIDKPVLITSKDAVKIKQVFLNNPDSSINHDLLNRLFILPVTAKLNQKSLESLKKSLNEFNISSINISP